MTAEQEQYVAEHVREALARHPAVGELGVDVVLRDGRVMVTGEVGTPERRDAITAVLSKLLPEYEIQNATTVAEIGDAAEWEELE